MIELYEYLDFRTYLSDYYEEKKQKQSGFSHRSFLQKAGISSPSFLKQVMDGRRNLTAATLEKFVKALKLGKKEGDFFRSLVWFNQAKSSEEKQHHYQHLRKLGNSANVKIVGEDSYDYYENWYTSAVREMVCIRDFRQDYSALAASMFPRITPGQAKRSVELLERMGMITRQEGAPYKQSDPIISTGHEVNSLMVRGFNRQMVELAAASLEEVPMADRNVTGVTMGVSKEAYAVLVQEIRAFQDRVLSIVEHDRSADAVYQMNVLLFPLSRREKGKES